MVTNLYILLSHRSFLSYITSKIGVDLSVFLIRNKEYSLITTYLECRNLEKKWKKYCLNLAVIVFCDVSYFKETGLSYTILCTPSLLQTWAPPISRHFWILSNPVCFFLELIARMFIQETKNALSLITKIFSV